jgi:hypothetical protein
MLNLLDTMADLADTDVGSSNMKELAVAGIAKYGGEKALQPVVGNGNMVSGASKLALAVGIDSVGGNSTVAKGTALGVGIDGIEDLLFTVQNQTGGFGLMGGSSSGTQVM